MFGILRKRLPAVQPNSAITLDQSRSNLDVWQRLSTGTPGLDDEHLRARLAQTVAWCDALTSLADLRSEALWPSLFHDGPNELVCNLGQSRQQQLRC